MLPQLFRTVGRFFGKIKAMAREFSQSMEEAANESGLTNKEISKFFDISVKTVEFHITKSYKFLKTQI